MLSYFLGKEINNNSIRTWIYAQDVAALERVLYEGEGNLLLKHASAHPKTRKFLESVPKLMVIKYYRPLFKLIDNVTLSVCSQPIQNLFSENRTTLKNCTTLQ